VKVLKRGCCLFVWIAFLGPVSGEAQHLVMQDTIVLAALEKLAIPGKSLLRYRFSQVMDYSLMASDLLWRNWQQAGNGNQVALLHNFKYNAYLFDDHHFRITNTFFHNLGVQIIFDSLTKVSTDDNTLDTRVEYTFGPLFSLSFLSNLTSRMLNGYDYQSDGTGSVTRVLNSTFLSPLIWTFSGGISLLVPSFLTFSLGISAAKFTWVKDKKRLESAGSTNFFGVPADKDHLFEYGISMHLLVDKTFGCWGNWSCDVLVFKNYNKPIDLMLKNRIGFKINKLIQATIQTKIIYEENVSKSVQLENLISLGFNIHL